MDEGADVEEKVDEEVRVKEELKEEEEENYGFGCEWGSGRIHSSCSVNVGIFIGEEIISPIRFAQTRSGAALVLTWLQEGVKVCSLRRTVMRRRCD